MDPDSARLFTELHALYETPPVPEHLRQHGAEQLRSQFAQGSANAPSRFWGIVIPRGEPLPLATAFAAIAAVALISLLAVALFESGLFGLNGFSDGRQPHPTPNSAQATLTAETYNGIPPVRLSTVAMVSASDGWAFGTSVQNGCLVLHYDGQSWKRSAGSACAYVTSISMLSTTDGWAVGYGYTNDPKTDESPLEILHYTNGSWQVQTTFPTPNQATPQSNDPQQNYSLRSIAMVSPTEGWAVGETDYASQNASPTALILHYANGQWTPAPIKELEIGQSQTSMLMSISMVGPNEGWAVGSYADTKSYSYQMLTLHYLNGTWRRVNWTEPGELNGVYALPSGDMWAVGGVSGVGPSAVVHLHNGALVSQISPSAGSLNAVQIFSTPTGWQGWVAGDGATTVHDVNNVWKREGYTIHGYTITSMSLTSPTEGWATGMLMGSGTGEYLIPNWNATLFHLHNGKWSVYPLAES
jgi:hypothetical protein